MSFQNSLPGVPFVESPFFDRLFADADPQTLAIAQALRRDGLALFDFPEPEFPALADGVIAELSNDRSFEEFRPANGDTRFSEAWQRSAGVRSIASNQAVVDLLGRLFGRRAFPFQTLNFPVGTQQPAHSDSVHFSAMPERFMCGVWVALEDIHPDAGPLMYYPGSHRLPIYTNEHIGFAAHKVKDRVTQHAYHQMWQDLMEAEGLKPTLIAPRRGQAVIWLANLLHGGSPQKDLTRTRWSQVTHYFFEDCAYYTPMYSNVPAGRIAFRDIVDIRSGETVPNRHLGEDVPGGFIQATSVRPPPPPKLSLKKRVARRLRKLTA